MAYADLELKLGTLVNGQYVGQLDEDTGEILAIDDSTGAYDAGTNPGGYGTPNPARSSLALILVPLNKKTTPAADPEDILLVPNAYDPVTITQFQIVLTEDGRIQCNGFLLELVTGPGNEGDIKYDVASAQVQLYTGGAWTEVTDLTTLIGNTNLVSDVLEFNMQTFISRVLNAINEERFDHIIGGEKCENFEQLTDYYNQVKGRIEQANYNFAQSNYYEYARIIEAAWKYINENRIA
jgi:hypothetical protein